MSSANLGKLAIAFLLLAAFKAFPQNTQSSSGSVATTHPITADMAAALLEGLDIQQHLLLGNSDTLHVRQLTPSVVQTIHSVTLAFVLGLGEPQYLQPEKMTELSGNARVAMNLALIKTLNLRTVACQGRKQHDEHGDENHEQGCTDVHYWLDLDNLVQMQQAMAIRLAQSFPEHAARIMTNHKTAQDNLSRIDAQARNILKAAGNNKTIVWHDAYAYFTAHYNLPDYASVNQADIHGGTLSGKRLAWLLSELDADSCLIFGSSFERDLQAKHLHSQIPASRFIIADLVKVTTAPSPAMVATEEIFLDIAHAFATCTD